MIVKNAFIIGIAALFLAFILSAIFHPLMDNYTISIIVISLFGVSLICIILGIMLGIIDVITHTKQRKEARREQEMDEKMKHEAKAISRLKNVFTEAGYSSDEVDEMTRLAVVILKEGTTYGDWASFGPTKLSTTIQSVMALKGKKPPLT